MLDLSKMKNAVEVLRRLSRDESMAFVVEVALITGLIIAIIFLRVLQFVRGP